MQKLGQNRNLDEATDFGDSPGTIPAQHHSSNIGKIIFACICILTLISGDIVWPNLFFSAFGERVPIIRKDGVPPVYKSDKYNTQRNFGLGYYDRSREFHYVDPDSLSSHIPMNHQPRTVTTIIFAADEVEYLPSMPSVWRPVTSNSMVSHILAWTAVHAGCLAYLLIAVKKHVFSPQQTISRNLELVSR